MVNCAVNGCYNNNNKSSKKYNVDVKYFTFPNNKAICVQWEHNCNRQRKFNVKTARICSSHFVESDFCLREKLLKLPLKKWKLKPDAVPSINLKKLDNASTESKLNSRVNEIHLMKNIYAGNAPEIHEQYFPAVKTEEIDVWETNNACVSTQIDDWDAAADQEIDSKTFETVIIKVEIENEEEDEEEFNDIAPDTLVQDIQLS